MNAERFVLKANAQDHVNAFLEYRMILGDKYDPNHLLSEEEFAKVKAEWLKKRESGSVQITYTNPYRSLAAQQSDNDMRTRAISRDLVARRALPKTSSSTSEERVQRPVESPASTNQSSLSLLQRKHDLPNALPKRKVVLQSDNDNASVPFYFPKSQQKTEPPAQAKGRGGSSKGKSKSMV